jgi:hypothetical protein
MKKPIRIFYSRLTERFYATRHYREIAPGVVECTGERSDVTNDIACLIDEHQITFRERPSDAPTRHPDDGQAG